MKNCLKLSEALTDRQDRKMDARVIREEIQDYVDEVFLIRWAIYLPLKKGQAPKWWLPPMDEIGVLLLHR